MSALWKSIKNNLKNSGNWLFLICCLYTLVYIGMILIHFFTNGKYYLDPTFTGFYIPLLVFYAGNKEVSRWIGKKIVIERPGELMVYLLWLIPVFLYIVNFFSNHRYKIPPDLKFACILVLSVFITSTISKKHYESKNGKDKTSS